MPMYQPSPKSTTTLVNSESRGLSTSVSAMVFRILSQVETTIELTNRICDRYLPAAKSQPMNSIRHSVA
jgi:hypothetical protein